LAEAIFECVPNISEGRDLRVVDACAHAAEESGARLLHRTSDAVHNRSVLTIAGSAPQVREAALALARASARLIDLRTHRGVHPRIGALDVLPFVPLCGATMAQAVLLARDVAETIWTEIGIPCFLYGSAAATPLRRNLANVRKGEFEGLDARFLLPEWRPDYGTVAKHPSAGAIAVGARGVLIAFNVELATGDLALARTIARRLRERDGGLKSLKALGLRLGPRAVQISLNLTDHAATPLYRIVELVRSMAGQAGAEVVRSELIGCIPLAAVRDSAAYYLGVTGPLCEEPPA
jgi:glutamate formiminotransferase